ncbi:pyridoxal phosphate-dependent aminotransferase [Shewanella avicenniae]|uniref:cysteine-S-conjugate beta-lyase n=1 Tax=Shewanella avicenniae TaxID=2814294 RepID=A0ABX7QN34_9GAMM|nr:MalY/PatB family protein [Shewanella avicenniae]QSX32123.1 pyridoxal phosphate-dependent aminotransferase [Shewanella avicenniae]
MQFNFDEQVERRGSNSYKWDSADDAQMLPMWVADMDFRTAPAIIEALHARVDHGIFGYTKVPERYFTAVTNWFATRHNFRFSPQSVLFTTGVVPALSAIIQALVKPGEGVIVPMPAYNCFFSSIRNSRCQQIDSPLLNDNGHFSFDFADIAAKAADPNNTLLLLCNPHNPVGRSWREDELRQLGEICFSNNVTVLSDEIHCDLMMPGQTHIPFASLGDEFLQKSVSCSSPSKSFNLAGVHVANILVEDAEFRKRIDKQININEVCEISPFAVTALIAAYEQGAPWLDELRSYLAQNFATVRDFIAHELPMIQVTPLEATYLAWLDCRALPVSSKVLADKLYQEQHLWLSDGTVYGADGDGFLRMNLATNHGRIVEGLQRLKAAVNDICG